MGRHRFIKERCTECKNHAHFGNCLLGKDEKERTIFEWLSPLQCLHVEQKPQPMHVDILNCETTQDFHSVQTHMHKKRDADGSLPSLHESKRQCCDTGEASADSPELPSFALTAEEVSNVLAATAGMPMRSLRSREDACITNEAKRYATLKLTVEICIAVIRFPASPSAPQILPRVIGSGPVTYVFFTSCECSIISVDVSAVLCSVIEQAAKVLDGRGASSGEQRYSEASCGSA